MRQMKKLKGGESWEKAGCQTNGIVSKLSKLSSRIEVFWVRWCGILNPEIRFGDVRAGELLEYQV